MKLFAYALREYDELGYLDACAREMGFEYGWTSEYPSLENVVLARGYDALCIITNPMPADLLDAFHEEGIKNLATRTIGYEHIDDAVRREGRHAHARPGSGAFGEHGRHHIRGRVGEGASA